MDEYISREALRDVIEGTTWYHVTRDGKLGQGAPCEEVAVYKATDILKAVIFAPAADVVEVVRCEKCVHKVDYKGRVMCSRRAIKYDGGWAGLTATKNDHYCSYGDKRKDGSGE